MREQNHVPRRESDRQTGGQTDRQKDGHVETNIPSNFVCEGYN